MTNDDIFADFAKKQVGKFCYVYLLNGVKLNGKIKSFDDYAMVVEGVDQNGNKTNEQVVRLAAIATILPQP